MIQTSLFLLLLFFILIISIFLKWISSHSKTHKNLPPSPWKLPFIGNLHQLGSTPHLSLLAMAKKHGPLMLLQLGRVPMLVASSAEAAQNILKTHDSVFCNRPLWKVPDTILYGSKDIAFCPYGEHWRQMKSIAVLRLLSNKRVQSFRKVREEETARMIGEIGESCGTSLVNLSELFVSLTNNVVCRVALGKTYQGLGFKNLLERLMDVLGALSVGGFIPWLSWVDRFSGLQSETDRVAKEFDELLEDVIEEHVNKRSDHGGGSDEEGQDLVDIFLDIQKEEANSFVVDRDTIKAVILVRFKLCVSYSS